MKSQLQTKPTRVSEFPRTLVVTIQGGGVYGLGLLGQLRAAESRLKANRILALAGSSAGAIIATLRWCGWTTDQIEDKLKYVADSVGVDTLLGPSDPSNPFNIKQLKEVQTLTRETFDLIFSENKTGKWFLVSGLVGFFRGSLKFFRGLWNFYCIRKIIKPHAAECGFFSGKSLEEQIDKWIRESPAFKGRIGGAAEKPITFGEAHDAMVNAATSGGNFVPALFLTVTDVFTGNVKLINSFEKQYSDISIAKAVRASAGFPLFFRPVSIPSAGSEERSWHIDGGVIANFPTWVFSYAIRRRLRMSEYYKGLAYFPWLHVGLALEDNRNQVDNSFKEELQSLQESSPPPLREYLGALVRLITGIARNRLEEKLSDSIARFLLVQQPLSESKAPKTLLDVNAVTSDLIEQMVEAGDRYADKLLDAKHLNFDLPETASNGFISQRLSRLTEKCTAVLDPDGRFELHLRANVFVPHGRELVMAYQWKMAGDPDEHLKFSNWAQGLTGYCFYSRRPQVCNLELLGQRLRRDESRKLFGMSADLHEAVKKDRTWLASFPLFDLKEALYRDDELGAELPDHDTPPVMGADFKAVRAAFDAPIFGVLNVDANLRYKELGISTDIADQVKDRRIEAVLNIIDSEATEIAAMMSAYFAGEKDE